MNLLYMIEQAIEKEFDIFKKENPIVSKRDIRPFRLGFIKGFRYGREKMYNEEEVHNILESYRNGGKRLILKLFYDKWFEQFKK